MYAVYMGTLAKAYQHNATGCAVEKSILQLTALGMLLLEYRKEYKTSKVHPRILAVSTITSLNECKGHGIAGRTRSAWN
jgi:hypothetical protein